MLITALALILTAATSLHAKNISEIASDTSNSVVDFWDNLKDHLSPSAFTAPLLDANATTRTTFGQLLFHNDSRKMAQSLEKAFKELDADHDGVLTAAEYSQGIKSHAESFYNKMEDKRQVNESVAVDWIAHRGVDPAVVLGLLDSNHDANVTLEEYTEQQLALFQHEFDFVPGLCDDVKNRLQLCDIDQQRIVQEEGPIRFKDMVMLFHGYCK